MEDICWDGGGWAVRRAGSGVPAGVMMVPQQARSVHSRGSNDARPEKTDRMTGL